VTRTQKLALAGSGTLLAVLVLVAAYVFATRTSSSAGGPGPGTSPTTTPPVSTPTTTTPPPAVVLHHVSFSNGPDPVRGWDTSVTLAFQGGSAPHPVVHPGSEAGSYTLTFSTPVSVPRGVLGSANKRGARYLTQLSWAQAARALTITETAFTGGITPVVATSHTRTRVRLVRTPSPTITNGCLSLTQPRPFTALTGVSVAKGMANVFEGGPFRLAARVPGQGETLTMVKVHSGPVSWAAPYPLPALAGPAEGLVAAWDVSAKDGSTICLVSVPVYFTHGS
jgi:hypothetical protein